MIVPPPTPNRPLKAPAAVAIATSFRSRSRATGGDTSGRDGRHRTAAVTAAQAVAPQIAELIAPLRADPASAAVLCDVDGTLAPIVDDPRGRRRAGADARRRSASWRGATRSSPASPGAARSRRGALVGVDELTYAGNHGLELLAPGASEAEPRARGRGGRAGPCASSCSSSRPDALERRRAAARGQGTDPGASLARGRRRGSRRATGARRSPSEAAPAGLEPHWGRKVLEIRPAAGIDKGTAVRRLLADHRIEQALFAGDDRTDLDAFRALRSLVDAGGLRGAVCIGIGSAEGPPELAEQADARRRRPRGVRSGC